jgi:hypothetical protein
LLIFVAKVAIKVSHGHRSCLALSHSMFNYGGAGP